VPFGEGCRRWAELTCRKFGEVLIGGCCIGRAITMNFLVCTVGAALLVFGITRDGAASGATAAFTLAIFILMEKPIRAYSDTILVCFVEAPEMLKSSASELYSLLADYYGKATAERATKGQ
jgi:hypothetical protein